MVKEFQYGMLLKQAIDFYKQGDYSNAKALFHKVLMMKPGNFISLFWWGRTALALGEYQQAKRDLNLCAELRPDLKQELIEPWASWAEANHEKKSITSEFAELNMKTDKLLESYSHEYTFKLKDLFIFALPFFLGSMLLGSLFVQFISKYHFSKYGSLLIFDSIQFWILISYIRHKIVLVQHPILQVIQAWQVLKEYVQSFLFILYAINSGFILKAIIGMDKTANFTVLVNTYRFKMSVFDYLLHSIHSLLFVPCIDSLFYVGIVYNIATKFRAGFRYVFIILCICSMTLISVVADNNFLRALPNGYTVVTFLMFISYYRYRSLSVPIITEWIGALLTILLLVYYKIFDMDLSEVTGTIIYVFLLGYDEC